MIPEPTIAEKHFARLIAFWHGQQPLYRRPGREGLVTVANSHGTGTGWSWEVDRYVESHWKEYVAAAREVIRERS